jgi:uncharacterized protein with HEPN domain
MRAEEFYLKDILVACQASTQFAREIDWEMFQHSRLYQSAIQYNLMIIGEAASKISRGLRSRHPEVDWQTIKDFRNILAHEYFALDLEIIWDSAATRTLRLSEHIRDILRDEYPDFPLPQDL